MQTDSPMDSSPSLSKLAVGAVAMPVDESTGCVIADFGEEETKCCTTSHSVIITRCSGSGETKHKDREIVEEQTTSTTTVSNAIQPCEVGDIVQGCRREKFELQRLNDRLSSFIERVRLLEAHNRTLAKEASNLRSNYSSDISRLRDIYNTDLEELKTSLAAAAANCAHHKLRADRAENELKALQVELRGKDNQAVSDKERLKSLNDQLQIAESEVQENQQRCVTMAEERARETLEFKNLQEWYKEVCLANERLSVACRAAEADVKILREEMEHRRRVQNAEMKELSALIQRVSTQEAVAIFRTEIMQVLREIHLEYEQRLEAAKADIHSAYMSKMRILCQTGLTGPGEGEISDTYLRYLLDEQKRKINALEEVKAEMELTVRELRRSLQDRQRDNEANKNSFVIELSTTQEELQRLRTDFEILLGSTIGLELEIASYWRLLEREEQRQVLGCPEFEKPCMGLALPENKSKLCSHTRSSKGNVCIIECAIDGDFVTLANTGSQDEDISGMRLVRQVDDQLTNTFVIPRDTVLVSSPSQRSMKIWSEGCKPSDEEGLELSGGRWETGANTRTALFSSSGEEKAVYTTRVMSQACVSSVEFQ